VALRNFIADLRKRASMGYATIPAGTTFAQAMYVACMSRGLDVDLSTLMLSERDVTSAFDRPISGTSAEELLEAVGAAFPSGAIRHYSVTIRGKTAILSFN
jgi:hypothetical protein